MTRDFAIRCDWESALHDAPEVRETSALLTIVLGTVFMVGQAREYLALWQSGVTLSRNLFATTFFTLTGFHGGHVAIGVTWLTMISVPS